MSANSLSGTLEPVALALGNHLWQSTLVAGVIALLTLALRKNRAQARYWLWLVASMKFLVPFSLFIILGGHLASLLHSTPPHQAAAESFVTIEQISQPFTNTPDFYLAQRPAAPAAQTSIADRLAAIWRREPLLPVGLSGVWLIGFLVVTIRWSRRWLRIAAAIRQTAPLHEGREFEMLRRMRRLAGLRQSIELRSLPASMEPGIFGIFRPVLLWPQAITERLEDTHLEAVVAHEVCHVRRWDNLTAAIHMVVEAIFWFHPLVWWLDGRLVAERERACDEEVLQLCRQHRIYAESILKICEFCIETPLACVSGITGADLKKRIAQIMSLRLGRELSLTKKVLLASAAALVVAGPLVFGLVYAQQVRAQSAKTPVAFDVATIKPASPKIAGFLGSPGGRVFFGQNIKMLVQYAFNLQDFQIIGGPDWVSSRWFEINAIPPEDSPSRNLKIRTAEPTAEQQQMLQSLLRDRFGLKYHFETKEGEVYILSRGSGKLQLKPTEHSIVDPRAIVFGKLGGVDLLPKGNGAAAKDNGAAAGAPPGGRLIIPDGTTIALQGYNTTTDYLALRMSRFLQLPVLNQTGIDGSYDFDVPLADPENDDMVVTVLNLVDGLGLKIKRGRGPVQTLVIDHIDLPTAN